MQTKRGECEIDCNIQMATPDLLQPRLGGGGARLGGGELASKAGCECELLFKLLLHGTEFGLIYE